MKRSIVCALALVVATSASAAAGTAETREPQKRPWHARHPALLGALVGIAAGVTTAYLQAEYDLENDSDIPRFWLLSIGVGAGAGLATYAAAGGFSKHETEAALERGRAELRFARLLAASPESVLGRPVRLR